MMMMKINPASELKDSYFFVPLIRAGLIGTAA